MSSVKTWRVVLLVVSILGLGWVASQVINGGSVSDQAVVETSSDSVPEPQTIDRSEALGALWSEGASDTEATPDEADDSASNDVVSGAKAEDADKPNLDPTALIASASHGDEDAEVSFGIVENDEDATADPDDDSADAGGSDDTESDEDADDSDADPDDTADTESEDAANDDATDADETDADESTVEATTTTTTTTTSTTTTSIYIDPNAEADEDEIRRVQAAQAAEEARLAAEARERAAQAALNPVPQQQTSGSVEPPKTTASNVTTSASLHVTEYNADGLPILLPLPTNPYEKTPDIRVGRIRIPRLGLDHSLHQGMTLTAINRGPSQWPGTALPGEVGNMVIGGHRTTYSRPFRHLDDLNPGDEIIYDTNEGSFTYLVTSVEIVSPNDVAHVAGQSHDKTATLFACHPPGSARQRIIVKMAMQ